MDFPQQNASRRAFMKTAAAAAAALAVPSALGFTPRRDYKPILVATQLYVVRKELEKDVPGTIAALAKLGYQGIEFADYHGLTAQQWRTLLDDNGLKPVGTHIVLPTLLGDELPKTVEFNQVLGNNNLIVRSMRKEAYASKEAMLRTAETYNEVADRLQPYGMRVGFHNHSEIFDTVDGEMLWNIFADATRKNVILQLDTGNAMHAPVAVDVLELIRRNAGRTVTMHVKPFSKKDDKALLGEDELDWPQIFTLSESVGGIEAYIIEYEVEGLPPLEALRLNLERFKKIRA
jgi:sugar phosphate isomerase/epimerase